MHPGMSCYGTSRVQMLLRVPGFWVSGCVVPAVAVFDVVRVVSFAVVGDAWYQALSYVAAFSLLGIAPAKQPSAAVAASPVQVGSAVPRRVVGCCQAYRRLLRRIFCFVPVAHRRTMASAMCCIGSCCCQ